jgi:hypothetical protein
LGAPVGLTLKQLYKDRGQPGSQDSTYPEQGEYQLVKALFNSRQSVLDATDLPLELPQATEQFLSGSCVGSHV